MPLLFVKDDITKLHVDAIVNAANKSLLGGGGVDGCIHRAAGPELLEECKKLGGCDTGDAKITKGYRLPAKYVIHTVGPIWRGGKSDEKKLLESCYKKSLQLAVENKLESIAFPEISTGAYGYPKDEARSVAIETILNFLENLTDNEPELTVYIVKYDSDINRGDFLSANPELYDKLRYVWAKRSLSSWDGVSKSEDTDLYPIKINEEGIEVNEVNEDFFDKEDDEDKEDSGVSASRIFSSFIAPSKQLFNKISKKTSHTLNDVCAEISCEKIDRRSIEDRIRAGKKQTFTQVLFDFIDKKHISDAKCYTGANVSRQVFSKIKCSNGSYVPQKKTILAFAISLKLDIKQTETLLRSAGLAFSDSNVSDAIVSYYIENKKYNLFEINEMLNEFNEPQLGGSVR